MEKCNNIEGDLKIFLNEAQHQIRVKQETNKIYKIQLVVQASFHKTAKVDEITTPPHPTFKS